MTAAELARKVFEHTLALVGAAVLDEAKQATDDAHYLGAVQKVVDEMTANLRRKFEQAIIELRFEFMAVTVAVLDEQSERAKLEAAAAYERGRKTAEGMTIEVVRTCARCAHGEDVHVDGACHWSDVLSGVGSCHCSGFISVDTAARIGTEGD